MRSIAFVAVSTMGALVAIAALAIAGTKDKVKLERKSKQGLFLLVKERQRTETQTRWKADGVGAAGQEEVEDVEREYELRLVAEKPPIQKRLYKTSTRLKRNPKNPDAAPDNTSVYGKTVIIAPDGMKIEGGAEMSKEDRDNLTTLERIVYACLPAKEVAPGEEWQVPGADLGRAVFGPTIDPTNFDSHGIGKLKEVVAAKDGSKLAKMLLKVSIKVKPTEVLPAIELDLKGQATFAIDDGCFTAFDLDGPVRYEWKKREDNGRESHATSEGTTKFSYKAEVLMSDRSAGESSSAGAKDGELARAKGLVCKNGHKFPVYPVPFCSICGEKLDEATRLCPKGCPFVYRRCPLCGEPLAPGE